MSTCFVLAGCILGMYGLHCEKNCSRYCAYDDCDRKTGTCLDGCKSGYIGSFCNQSKSYWRKNIHSSDHLILFYKCLNIYTYTPSACLSVCRFVHPSIHPSIHQLWRLNVYIWVIFQLVLLVNTDQTAEKYVDIVTTTQTVTILTGHVWRDVNPVIGTMIVKHVRYFFTINHYNTCGLCIKIQLSICVIFFSNKSKTRL